MRYLSLALFAEGPTDYYFLRPLLQRLCEDICVREARMPVEVSEVLGLDDPDTEERLSRDVRIARSAQMARGAWNILFVHADGANDPDSVREEQITPALHRVRELMGAEGLGVAVVPIRETEAWAIVDGSALRCAFGTELNDQELGLPPTRNVESITDPKIILQRAFTATHPTGRRLRQGTSPYLNTLGEQVSLDFLRRIPSFSSLENDIRLALNVLGLLR
ncbi:DUF4276 family protein [Pseudomonas aeruginosa]|uniref:DUF4276 family protein n=1 Tax=Pseudomonas aeruginosa TaxID=287 RepID=UPI0009A31E47|nr:DUF4276 family protein [Pseudomonas aeruginosa]EJB8380894.1 DUF4276 family protein [Pseudomonas aeruginosa]GLF58851.1 hypothetical protein VNPA141826_30100 [Pseudomonas aeruginosa]GLF77366.1 hypothetical protein VNPA152081_24380 [Pseudomonas aeruginosa]HBO3773874.1 DUF4276 family protein [Pseudomonas aeruginosa]HEK1344146.1 DUF4276 family protein [Pseudomonas aeruginosa]